MPKQRRIRSPTVIDKEAPMRQGLPKMKLLTIHVAIVLGQEYFTTCTRL